MARAAGPRSGRRGFVVRLLPALLLPLLLTGTIAACGDSESSEPTEAARPADRFDAAAAWRHVERQVAVGQRPAGSPQLRKLATELRPLLPDGRFEPVPGEPGLRNIVGELPGRSPGVVVGAHYDTLTTPPGFVGANNGAAGTAAVIEIARALERLPAPPDARSVSFVLFDGEEPDEGTLEESSNPYLEGLRGSRAYAESHRGETAAMVLLDYVGNRDLHLKREFNSTRALWDRLMVAASKVNTEDVFSNDTGVPIGDDHIPFLRQGVPAIDLIDWTYPGHSLADKIDKLSQQSLDAVGETVVQLVTELR